MAKGKRRDKSKEAYWQQKFDEHRQSGLSIRAFCHKHGLTETAFYFWRRELTRRQVERPSKPRRRRALFVPIRVAPGFVPKESGLRRGETEAPSRHVGSGEIAIALGDGRRIHLTPPVDKQTLGDILAVMEARAC